MQETPINRAPNASNAIWVRSFQAVYDLFWMLWLNGARSRTDMTICHDLIYSFGEISSKVYIGLFIWSAINIPISRWIAKKAQITGVIEYPKIVSCLWFLYYMAGVLIWFFALVAIFTASRCPGQPLTIAAWCYLLTPVLLCCCVVGCTILFNFRGDSRKGKESDDQDSSGHNYYELPTRK